MFHDANIGMPTREFLMNTTPWTTFKVADMSCGHCVGSITKAVKTADPSAEVDVDLAGKQVRVRSAAAPAATLRQAIEDAGFTPVAA